MIVLFIGSFNPVTKAHQEIVRRIKEMKETKKVVIVPVGDNYGKQSLNTSFKDRKAMLELVFDDEISDFENKQRQQVKTLITLKHFDQLYDDDLAIVIGADNLETFNQWYKVEDILEHYFVVVVNRQNNLEKIINQDPLLKKYQDRFIVLNDFNIEASSSQARANISSDFLDEKVVDYIKKKRLY